MRRLKQLACALFCLLSLASPTLAQGPVNATSEQEREYDAAFQEMMRKPADLDVLFKFATIATKTGDYEGAISALERMVRRWAMRWTEPSLIAPPRQCAGAVPGDRRSGHGSA